MLSMFNHGKTCLKSVCHRMRRILTHAQSQCLACVLWFTHKGDICRTKEQLGEQRASRHRQKDVHFGAEWCQHIMVHGRLGLMEVSCRSCNASSQFTPNVLMAVVSVSPHAMRASCCRILDSKVLHAASLIPSGRCARWGGTTIGDLPPQVGGRCGHPSMSMCFWSRGEPHWMLLWRVPLNQGSADEQADQE